jgi:hypothetical protein
LAVRKGRATKYGRITSVAINIIRAIDKRQSASDFIEGLLPPQLDPGTQTHIVGSPFDFNNQSPVLDNFRNLAGILATLRQQEKSDAIALCVFRGFVWLQVRVDDAFIGINSHDHCRKGCGSID